jgi:hypothetical protein
MEQKTKLKKWKKLKERERYICDKDRGRNKTNIRKANKTEETEK